MLQQMPQASRQEPQAAAAKGLQAACRSHLCRQLLWRQQVATVEAPLRIPYTSAVLQPVRLVQDSAARTLQKFCRVHLSRLEASTHRGSFLLRALLTRYLDSTFLNAMVLEVAPERRSTGSTGITDSFLVCQSVCCVQVKQSHRAAQDCQIY